MSPPRFKLSAPFFLTAALLLLMGSQGCTAVYYWTHLPSERTVFQGQAQTDGGQIRAALKLWSFKAFTAQDGTKRPAEQALVLEVTNKAKGNLALKRYVAITSDGQELAVAASDFRPSVVVATGEQVFAPRSRTTFTLPEPFLSLFQEGRLAGVTVIFDTAVIRLVPIGKLK